MYNVLQYLARLCSSNVIFSYCLFFLVYYFLSCTPSGKIYKTLRDFQTQPTKVQIDHYALILNFEPVVSFLASSPYPRPQPCRRRRLAVSRSWSPSSPARPRRLAAPSLVAAGPLHAPSLAVAVPWSSSSRPALPSPRPGPPPRAPRSSSRPGPPARAPRSSSSRPSPPPRAQVLLAQVILASPRARRSNTLARYEIKINSTIVEYKIHVLDSGV